MIWSLIQETKFSNKLKIGGFEIPYWA